MCWIIALRSNSRASTITSPRPRGWPSSKILVLSSTSNSAALNLGIPSWDINAILSAMITFELLVSTWFEVVPVISSKVNLDDAGFFLLRERLLSNSCLPALSSKSLSRRITSVLHLPNNAISLIFGYTPAASGTLLGASSGADMPKLVVDSAVYLLS